MSNQPNTVILPLEKYERIMKEHEQMRKAIETIRDKGGVIFKSYYNYETLFTAEEVVKKFNKIQKDLENTIKAREAENYDLIRRENDYSRYFNNEIDPLIIRLKQENQSLKDQLSQRTLWQWFKGLFISNNQQPPTNN